LFEWGVGVHDSNIADAYMENDRALADEPKLDAMRAKAKKQALKDYVLFPLLAGPMAPAVLAGNVVANLIRNYAAWAVIYVGHFPEGTALYTEDQLADETRAAWCLRQVTGSVNIEGGRLIQLMTGHLSQHIEHHLFPTIPGWRYPQMAPEVQAICAKYGVPYHTSSFAGGVAQVIKRIARLSFPQSLDELLNWRKNAKAMRAIKDRGAEVLAGKRQPGARDDAKLPPVTALASRRPAAHHAA
jgi:linoleoyl-CoA desaturase